jgi:hypothetical protein
MQEASLLETTAEVSIAFAGFIGVFLILAARDGRFPPGDSFVIRLIVTCSVGPVFLAVMPLILNGLGVSGPQLWRVSSIALTVGGATAIVYLARQLRGLESGEGRALNYGFVLWMIAAISCLANALGWPWAPNGGVYLLTVWSIIGVAAGNFVELLFRKVL